jgi:hypothetical protein
MIEMESTSEGTTGLLLIFSLNSSNRSIAGAAFVLIFSVIFSAFFLMML